MDGYLQNDKPIFRAIITPNRSLSHSGRRKILQFFSLYFFALGCFFLSKGWWPLHIFMGLDLIALYFAFKVNFERAKSKECITLLKNNLIVEKQNHKGQAKQWELQPFWTRIAYEKSMDEDQLEHLYLCSKQQKISIATDLSRHERFEFYKALKRALLKVNHLPDIEIK